MKISQLFSFILILSSILMITAGFAAADDSASDDTVRVLYVNSMDLIGLKNNSSVNGTPFIVDKISGYDPASGWTEPSKEYLELAATGFAGYDVLFIDMVSLHNDELLAEFQKAKENGILLISVRSAPAEGEPYMPEYFDIREERKYSPDNEFSDKFFTIYDNSSITGTKLCNAMTTLLVDRVLEKRAEENKINVLYVCAMEGMKYYFKNPSYEVIDEETGKKTIFTINTISGYDPSGWTEPSKEYLELAENDFAGYDVLFIDMVNIYKEPIATAFENGKKNGMIMIAIHTGPNDTTCYMPEFFDIRDVKNLSPQNDFTDRFFEIDNGKGKEPSRSKAMAKLLAETINKKEPAKKATIFYLKGTADDAWTPDNEEVDAGTVYKVSPYRASCEGVVFKGWLDSENEYIAPGDAINVNENVSLTAQWTALENGFIPATTDIAKLKDIILNDGEYVSKYDIEHDGELDIFDLVLMAQYVADN